MYEIEVTDHFSSAHRLRGEGSCCENLHGHNWFVTVFVRCRDLDGIGIGIDFKAVKREMEGVLAALDHRDLNSVPPFDAQNPSAENIARFVLVEMQRRLSGHRAKVHRVRVSEGPNTAATCMAEE